MAKYGAPQVEAALRAGPFRAPAHAWLSEVRNQTGYGKVQRSADGLVVSLWPSRGIWFAGVEIKVSRGDWLREVDDPTKAAEIQRFCDYWWVAAPAGVVEVAEIPETWGYIEVNGKKCKTVKQAPRLTPEPLKPSFVASVLRNMTASEEQIRKRVRAEIDADHSGTPTEVQELRAKFAEVQRERDDLARTVGWKEGSIGQLKRSIAEFERAAGIPEGTVAQGNSTRTGELYATALALARFPPASIASALREAAESMDSLASIHAQQERRG